MTEKKDFMLGFSLAVGSGSLIAGKVGETVLNYQTTTDAQYNDSSNNSGYTFTDPNNYFTEVTQDDLLSQYHDHQERRGVRP